MKQTASVGGQILRHGSTRRNQRGEVVWPKRFDGRSGYLAGGHRRLTGRNRAIHQNDDETPLLLPDLVRDDVKGNRRRQRHSRIRTARGKLDGREGTDRSLHSVLEDSEIRRVQPSHRLPLAVQYRDIEL